MSQQEQDYNGWKGKTPACAIARMIAFHEGKAAARGAFERLPEIDDIVDAAIRMQIPEGQPVIHNVHEVLYSAEECECAMMFLDDNKVPKCDDDGKPYSLVGRIMKYAEMNND